MKQASEHLSKQIPQHLDVAVSALERILLNIKFAKFSVMIGGQKATLSVAFWVEGFRRIQAHNFGKSDLKLIEFGRPKLG